MLVLNASNLFKIQYAASGLSRPLRDLASGSENRFGAGFGLGKPLRGLVPRSENHFEVCLRIGFWVFLIFLSRFSQISIGVSDNISAISSALMESAPTATVNCPQAARISKLLPISILWHRSFASRTRSPLLPCARFCANQLIFFKNTQFLLWRLCRWLT